MAISTQGKTSKAGGASLNVKVSQQLGEADIHKVDLTLPTALPARLTTLQQACTEAQFAALPDAPTSSFETNLPEGPHSVLSANGNLCTSKLTIPTELIGQNGAKVTQNTKVVVTGCPKAKVLTRAQKLAVALKACHKKPKGTKRKTCERPSTQEIRTRQEGQEEVAAATR